MGGKTSYICHEGDIGFFKGSPPAEYKPEVEGCHRNLKFKEIIILFILF